MLSIQNRLDYMLYALDVYYSNAKTVQCAHTHVLGGGCVIHYTFMTHLLSSFLIPIATVDALYSLMHYH